MDDTQVNGSSLLEFSSSAHNKLVCHAAKFSLNHVLGLLIGKTTESSKKDGDDDHKPKRWNTNILDVVPLSHSNFPDLVTMEIGFEQTQLYCEKRGMAVLGLYFASASLSASSNLLPDWIVNLATAMRSSTTTSMSTSSDSKKHIKSTFQYVVLINNRELSNLNEKIYPFTLHDNNWVLSLTTCPIKLNSNSADLIKKLLRERIYQRLIDFEMHLENLSLNYLENSDLSL